jgi:hypothetical protein
LNTSGAVAAVKNLAEEPFARIRAAALGEILRTDFFGELRDLGGFGDAGVVLPEPRHRRGIFREAFAEGERLAFGVDGQGSAAGGIDADADDLRRVEAADVFLRVSQRFLDDTPRL